MPIGRAGISRRGTDAPTPEQVNQSIVDEIKTLQNVLAQFK